MMSTALSEKKGELQKLQIAYFYFIDDKHSINSLQVRHSAGIDADFSL